ncbi:MAG: hypothetical protein KKG75_03515 [Nanoarchaeota archaeon]|nr:hypothetical protein [Nanoarchaeota archaeon]
MQKLLIKNHNVKRYPNLSTILMVEDYLKKHRDGPIKISEIKKKLPKQVMHQTLIQILNYLQISGKILIGTKGVLWIFTERKELNKLIEGGLEI